MSSKDNKVQRVPAMSGTPDEELELTAQPTSLPDELGSRANSHDVGLSVDPDDLGRNFLSEATEQANFESEYDESIDRYATGDARSDEALVSPNFEANQDVWENTINNSLEGNVRAHGDLVDDHVDGMRFVEDDDEPTESEDLDLTENAVQDASLMDHEGEQYGETESPELRTDDAGSHGRRRGGHQPRTATHVSQSRGR